MRISPSRSTRVHFEGEQAFPCMYSAQSPASNTNPHSECRPLTSRSTHAGNYGAPFPPTAIPPIRTPTSCNPEPKPPKQRRANFNSLKCRIVERNLGSLLVKGSSVNGRSERSGDSDVAGDPRTMESQAIDHAAVSRGLILGHQKWTCNSVRVV
jgi:hypothetical protein